MKVELNTDFPVPIWRFYMSGKYDIPYAIEVDGKEFRNRICIIQIACFVDEYSLKHTNYMDEDSINLWYGDNHIVCVPNLEILTAFKKYRPTLNVCLANQNAFIDETFYNIDYTQPVSNDLFVSSQFLSCKNLHLLHDIDNVCGVGYYGCPETSVHYSPFPSSVKRLLNFEHGVDRVRKNFKWVYPKDMVKEINSSKIGGIFSTQEGSCFSSSEYLLCGIPVLSCKCKGGREIWYNEDNCELCDPDNSSVRETLGRMLNKYDKGEYDREAIRNRHIELMGVHRKNLSNAILDIMKKMVAPDKLPSVEEVTESIKHYHSNNQCFTFTPGYKRQTERELRALRILNSP